LSVVKASEDKIGLDRLIFFSDAVFAIAITLLSLDIRLPNVGSNVSNADLAGLLLSIWPKYLAYIISFLVIGLFWMGHHRKFRVIRRFDNAFILLNLVLLMAIAFIPFVTSILSEFGNRTATIFYALTMVATGLVSSAIWQYAWHSGRLVQADLDGRHHRRETLGPLLVISIFLVSIGLAFVNADLAKLSWLLVLGTQSIYG
jgi:uncharacterized membrane protein